jgi:hypothetical protein
VNNLFTISSTIDSTFPRTQTFADCISGIVPALLILVLKQCADPTTGAIKQTAFIAKLKDTLKEGGWGHTLLDAMIQDAREEYVHPFITACCRCAHMRSFASRGRCFVLLLR